MNTDHIKTYTIIMAVCALLMVIFALFSYVISTGERSGVAEATATLATQNHQKIVALQITLATLETQMSQISMDIAEIKQDLKKLRCSN